MAQYSTRKASASGKAETLHLRALRRAKYAPSTLDIGVRDDVARSFA